MNDETKTAITAVMNQTGQINDEQVQASLVTLFQLRVSLRRLLLAYLQEAEMRGMLLPGTNWKDLLTQLEGHCVCCAHDPVSSG